MQIKNILSKTALVLETNNLRGGKDASLVVQSLKRLIKILDKQTVPLKQLTQVVITHDGLSLEDCQQVETLAGYPIEFVQIQSNAGYYDAKNIGFDATNAQHCQYVVFCDSDCIPAADWLEQLLIPFISKEAPAVVVGRTSYQPTLVGTALTTIDFMYFRNRSGVGTTSNFYANNVVFQRQIFERYRYQPLDGMYRGHCQVLGMRLTAAGLKMFYTPHAHTVHRLPDTRRQALKLRWIRGQDSVVLTPHLVRTNLSRRWWWLAHSGPLGPMCVMAVRLGYSLRALNKQDLVPVYGLRKLLTIGLILGFSAVDTLGALARSIGINTVGRTAADAQALSYHGQ